MQFALTVEIELTMYSTAAGGRPTPILSGYWPVCRMRASDGRLLDVGLCELTLAGTQELAPGAAGAARLQFEESVAEFVSASLRPGSRFELAEGAAPVANAVVVSVQPIQTDARRSDSDE